MDQEANDANSLLCELDRGLQSQNIGDQSEAVARFTRLFHRHPLPLLINAACLKLAEAYRLGSNFLRIQICEVIERNQDQLHKIYNIDDFYRSIFTVTTSNDPIARSLTLLTLGNIAPIVSEYKAIHYCINGSLDSKIECELNAAITCAASYVKYSSEFASHVYPKIVKIIDHCESTSDIQSRALSVLNHGFYNANEASVVRLYLIDVMARTRSINITRLCLMLSTNIAYTSLSHIETQIEFLIQTFLDNPRSSIRYHALDNLKFLADKCPHIWQSSHVEPLVTQMEHVVFSDPNQPKHQFSHLILTIYCNLFSCKCNFISQLEKARIFRQCYHLATTNKHNLSLCCMAFQILTVMSEEQLHCSTAENMTAPQQYELTTDILTAIKSFLTDSNQTSSQTTTKSTRLSKRSNQNIESPPPNRNLDVMRQNHPDAKAIHRHIVKLCELNPEYRPELLKLLMAKISAKDYPLDELTSYKTELMCAIMQSTTEVTIAPENCWKFIKTRSNDMSQTNLLNLCVLYFQTSRLKGSPATEEIVERVTHGHGLWFSFKIMRQAMRYGFFGVAKVICDGIHEMVTTDTTDFYFKSLGKMCQGESMLDSVEKIDSNLNFMISIYEEAVPPLRASIGNFQTTTFQLQYVQLRVKSLQVHRTLRQTCRVYEASPMTYSTLLSAIGANRGTIESGLTRSGFIHQMLKISKEFRSLANAYGNLASISFNCDNRTLDYVHLLQHSATIMADAIDSIFQYGKNIPIDSKIAISNLPSGNQAALEHRALEAACLKMIDSIRGEIIKPGIYSSSANIDPLVNFLKRISGELLAIPFVFPRYFFQAIQMTQIKLAITPQPSPTSGALTVLANQHLVLRVEGLIENLSKRKTVIRDVSKTCVSVNVISTKPNESCTNQFVQSTATPNNNYFKTEFLFHMKWLGNYVIEIVVSIIDEQDCVWQTNLKEKLNVLVT